MHLQIPTDTLRNALRRAASVASAKTTMPILSCVLLDAGKALRVTAFDLDTLLTTEADAKVTKPGRVCAPAKELLAIVGTFRAPETMLHFAGNTLKVTSEAAEFSLRCLSADEFPTPKDAEATTAPVDGAALLAMIEKVEHAVSYDESRHMLNGAYLHATKDGVRMAATDGHRLATAAAPFKVAGLKPKDDQGVIVPRKALNELKRLLLEDASAVEVGIADAMFAAKSGKTTLAVRLIDGKFPDYEQVIPKEGEALTFPRGRLLDTLKRVSLLSEEKSVRLRIGDRQLSVTAHHADLGEAREDLPVETDRKVVVGFNASYLADALAVIESEDVAVEIKDDQSPGVIRALNDATATYVVMPVRV